MFERFTEKARRVIFFARYEASQKVLMMAAEEADSMGHRRVGTEHLLLGLYVKFDLIWRVHAHNNRIRASRRTA